MYDYGYGYTGYEEATTIAGGIFATMGLVLLISSIVGIVMLVSQWKIYKKAGKAGWECLIPIYNIVVLLQIVELPTWNILLFFVPIANIYVMFRMYIELAHKFGKSTGFGVLTVFFSVVCLPILAFGKDNVYQGANVQMNKPDTMDNDMNTPYDMVNFQSSEETITFNPTMNTTINPIPKQINPDQVINVAPTVNNIVEPNNQMVTQESMNQSVGNGNIAPTPETMPSAPQPELPVNKEVNNLNAPTGTIPQPIPTTNIMEAAQPTINNSAINFDVGNNQNM